MLRKLKMPLTVKARVRAPCEEAMRVGSEVEYQTGIAEYGRGVVTAIDLVNDCATITGCDWTIPLRDVLEMTALPAFNAWRAQWLVLAEVAMSSSGMDKDDVFFFASDNDGNLRSDFKAGKDVESSVKWHAGGVAHLPRFDNIK